MGSRFTEDDFGITHLASLFHQDWRMSGSARDVVVDYVGQTSAPYAVALAEDALRLMASGAAGTVETLWECITGSNYRLDVNEVNGLDWVREIAVICEASLRGAGLPASREVGESLYGGLTERVVAEIDEIGPALVETIERNSWKGIPSATSELRKCATEICPELAFRIFLRVLMEYSFNINRRQYVRFVELGHEFSYGDFVVSRTEFLIQ
ncbi:hypothetical protein ACQEVG_05350 [Streptomyces sp. CA-135486]|uniref:hypothetical protein n=1 Tax=Streptomyces sp. CA-135486 TaxID=3240049 RepID=UPI003D8E172F